MKQEIAFKNKQSLKITNKMKQSIQILHLGYLDLLDTIGKESLDNPFLEYDDTSITHNNNSTEGSEDHYNISKNNSFQNQESQDSLENLSSETSLEEHVELQIATTFLDQREKIIAVQIKNLIDSNGYLHGYNSKEIAQKLICDPKNVDAVFEKMRKFDPAGIFCTDLRDCLMLQLIDKGLYSNSYKLLLENIELIPKLEHKKLSKICEVSENETMQMIKTIKSLNPKPGGIFDKNQMTLKIPEMIVVVRGTEISISINRDVIPKVWANKEYYLKIKQSPNIDQKYLHEEYLKANGLVNSLNMRFKTLFAITSAIVSLQKDFFLRGIMHLKPLVLEQIAKITGMHESTISRAVSNKFISTPYGEYEIKFLFSNKVKTSKSQEEFVSNSKVKEFIKEIINSEGENVLSDDEISEMLQKFNIKLARRTVAKYRESLNIPASSIRKKMIKK